MTTQRRSWGVVATIVVALLALGPVAMATDPGPAPHAVVGKEGRWLVDRDGRVLVVHGFNMVAKLEPYTAQSVGFGDDDAEFLASNGFNVVRLGMMWKAVEPEPGVYDDEYLEQISETVDTLAEHGIYTLIDFHQDSYNEKVGGQGFPDWAVDTRIGGLLPAPQVPIGDVSPDQYAAWDNFWANVDAPDGVPLWERFARFWRHVAARFNGNPWVIGYDLMNEPNPGTQAPLCVNTVVCPFDETLGRFYAYVIPKIRAVDPDHLVWYEPNIFAGGGGAMNIDHGGDPRAVLSFHNYCGLTALSSGNLPPELRDPGCPSLENTGFDHAEEQAARNGDALVMTEFGSTPHVPELVRVAAAADARRMGWIEWTYHNTGHTNFAGEYSVVKDPAKPPAGDNVDSGLLAALARPYPQAIAGTPGEWSFDPDSRTFTLTYTPTAALVNKHTVIAVPIVQYPDGYAVDVMGGRTVGHSRGSVRVAADDTSLVTVTIRPARR